VDHLASAHQFLSDWTPAKFINQAQNIHTDVRLYIEGIFEHKSYPE
jgi:hypothetical protein